MAIMQPLPDVQSTTKRRTLLYLLPSVPLVAAAASWLSPLTTGRGRGVVRTEAAEVTPGSLYAARARGRQLMESYPQPLWLPEDFQVLSAIACSTQKPSQRGMFLGIDDDVQLCISAQRRSARSHSELINSSLLIHMAPADQMPELRVGKNVTKEPVVLRTEDGNAVNALYYDHPGGNPEAFGAAHAIALLRGRFAVLVASYYKNRVTRAQLEHIAVSIAPQLRLG